MCIRDRTWKRNFHSFRAATSWTILGWPKQPMETKPDTSMSSLRLSLLLSIVTIILSASLGVFAKPNIILIVTDDQGYSDMGITGRTWDVKTPNMDRLAESGIRFENGYATSGVCSPSRCALITGVYQERQGNYWFGGPGIPSKQYPTLAEKLKSVGYATAYIGKSQYGQGDKAVSYTHLTLPTISSV